MVEVLDALRLTTLVTTVHRLSAVGAAAILAEAGDRERFDCPYLGSSTAGCARGRAGQSVGGRAR